MEMYEDTIYVFKDSDLQIFGKSICEINIDEKEIQNINSRSRIDIVSVWLEKNCDKKYAFALLANIPDEDQYDESWIALQVGGGENILDEIISELVCMQPGSVKIPFSTYFHHDTPEFDYSLEIKHQKYRFIAEKYKKFKLLIFEYDLFLEHILKQQKNDILKDIIENIENKKENPEIEKAHIVETLFAHMTKAYFWNPSPKNAIEKEISNKIEKNEIEIKKLGYKEKIVKGELIQGDKKVKILYLNVNGFFGNRNKREEGLYLDKSEAIFKAITGDNENYDFIFLSEIAPHSDATKNFVAWMEKKDKDKENVYQCISPQKNKKWSKLNGSSCTLCFKRKRTGNVNEENEFNGEGTEKDFLQLCKIVSPDKNIVLLGIHWATQISDWERTKDFVESLSRLMPDASKNKILLFGDTNANPDIKFEKSNDEETYINNMEKYITNCLFESQMKCAGLKEIFPSATDDKNNYNTTNFGKDGTRIDRVFTNIPGVAVKVKRSFLKNELSDHAALIITFDE